MTTHNQDWKDIANAQFSKALALSLTLLIFGIMVTPKVEVRKQVFQTQQMELVDIPMEERERIEAPQTEVDVNVSFQISDVLGTEEVDMAAFQEALSQIGDIYKTTTTSVQQQEDERVVNFVPYDDAPVIIGKIEPVYPEFAKRNKLQGTVVLEVEVLKDGSIRDIRVRRGVGGGLDEAAIEAVRKVRFQPGKSSGQAVDCLVIIPVEFKIQ
ncbi:MAG TPA: energy transducer TonB [Candidatus Cloacimonas sp.]|jgi:protein TonB|nr:energy transducer TonB [Candidatus Cloacimonas sp.]HNV93288.1 energy transducer TonB [Candidatus Cloacimonas sp.]HPV64340.1 energy transducer TonB [Candidatus Cloacimonas sp.]HQJ95503.1 energy transducer TonB [Candidatus Cloacimonas sp.]HQM16914.1 energy transducer TonB [Candidatus Cloacimonas sp.]